jgi:hypothetical protein
MDFGAYYKSRSPHGYFSAGTRGGIDSFLRRLTATPEGTRVARELERAIDARVSQQSILDAWKARRGRAFAP